ncbi:hypothetical protein [Arcobacter sp. LA11]|uniref:hypothetical protein n=1 Tax=Arcobacter sp. LA11 TaxID=1898176 RepID=UPI0009342474|nr:hypothetical protein [Arcobacter sp. LA11]
MIKVLLFLLCFNILNANECSPYFNPEKFYETPEALSELLDENFPNGIFIDTKFDNEIKINDKVLKKDYFVKDKEYIYPIKSGFWKYKKMNNKIDEVNLARAEIYRFADTDIANTINDDFENFWNDYLEDAYEMQLTPEQTLFRYNNTYFTMSVFIYGVKGDSTPLKGTVVNLWLKDYTKEVNTHIKCMKEKNDS